MTKEQEWQATDTVVGLDLYRNAKNRHRKWRLFGVACARRAMAAHFPDPRLEPVAGAAERLADGTMTWDELKRVRRVLTAVRKEMGEEFGPDEARVDVLRALDVAAGKTPVETLQAGEPARFAFSAATRIHLSRAEREARTGNTDWEDAHAAEEREQVRLARDIFGNPFRPVAFDPAWRTPTVDAVASGVYSDRAFDRLPVLADALEDDGCDTADLLAHLRSPGPHVRGCWALDLVLGKA